MAYFSHSRMYVLVVSMLSNHHGIIEWLPFALCSSSDVFIFLKFMFFSFEAICDDAGDGKGPSTSSKFFVAKDERYRGKGS